MQRTRPKKVKDRIGDLVRKLADSDFYRLSFKPCLEKCLKGLEPREIDQILCYGLGSFHDGVDVISRYQLALLLLMHDHLMECGAPVNQMIEIYDPLFDQNDIDTLSSYRKPIFKLIDENEYCARCLSSKTTAPNRCTLVYMPHLDKYLYNNLLGINWNVDNLSQLVILGNSFHEMVDSEIGSKINLEIYYINQLVNFQHDKKITPNKNRSRGNSRPENVDNDKAKALIELHLDHDSFEHSDIFNSLSFHYFNDSWLKDNAQKLDNCRLTNWSLMTSSQQD